jgi:hypothetical protein
MAKMESPRVKLHGLWYYALGEASALIQMSKHMIRYHFQSSRWQRPWARAPMNVIPCVSQWLGAAGHALDPSRGCFDVLVEAVLGCGSGSVASWTDLMFGGGLELAINPDLAALSSAQHSVLLLEIPALRGRTKDHIS